MRFDALFLVVSLLCAPAITMGQSAQVPPQPVAHVVDGGTNGTMESIFVPPLKSAPFSLMLDTEWLRPLGNGGTFTLANQRRIARDGKGRIYQERWILVPKRSKIPSRMNLFQITDPAQHTWYDCHVQEKICELLPYTLSADKTYKPVIGVTGPLSNGSGSHQHEDLGLGNTEGVDTTGYRETTTINAGALGNDAPMVITREFWFSSQLGINIISKVDDPQNGRQVFTVRELVTSEPDPRLFAVPEGYQVIDHSKPDTP